MSTLQEYMDNRRIEWEQDKEFTEEQVRSMELNNYYVLITSGSWYTKNPKYSQILTLVVVDQTIEDDSKKSPEKHNRESIKV